MRKTFIITISAIAISAVAAVGGYMLWPKEVKHVRKHYEEISMPTPNIGEGVNEVKGIILHHTAEPTAASSLAILTSPEAQVSSHVVIDTDGTRYILAEPTQITWHAGFSVLNGREKCNQFTIGIEFQGNTLETPLTNDQIDSGIEYILPLMAKYGIKKENIVTHEKIRMDWMAQNPDLVKEKNVSAKVDITPTEYQRFMLSLEEALEE